MNTQITITKAELITILSNVEKATFANIVIKTIVRMNKKENPYYGLINKTTKTNVLCGTNYQDRVNNNLKKEEKESDFVVSENKVGKHVGTCLLYNENTQKFYFQYELFDAIKPSIVEYEFNGQPIEKKVFEQFMIISKPNTNQNLENTVKIFSVTVDNIKEMSLNGKKYLIVD